MRVGRALTDAKLGILKTLLRLRYATAVQTAYWTNQNRHQSRTYALLTALIDDGLVKRHPALQPHVFSLSRAGFRVLTAKPPTGSRHESWPVLTHRCHANEVEIKLLKHYPDFQFLSRPALYSMGLNPAIGEHGGRAHDRLIYVLVDDYYMPSDRLLRVKSRPHRPKKHYFNFKSAVPTWETLADTFICATTQARQYAAHKQFLEAHELDFALLKIESLW